MAWLPSKRREGVQSPATWGIEYAAWASKLNYEEIIDIAAAPWRYESVEHSRRHSKSDTGQTFLWISTERTLR